MLGNAWGGGEWLRDGGGKVPLTANRIESSEFPI